MSDEIPYSGTHYEVLWHSISDLGPEIGYYRIRNRDTGVASGVYLDLELANRKAKALDAKANQADAFTAPEPPSKE